MPGVGLALGDIERLPVLVALEHIRVLLQEVLALHGPEDLVGHVLRARPDVAEEDRSVGADAEWLAGEVEVHATGERIRDDQWRRRQVVVARERIDAALEVAVAREHARDKQLAPLDRAGDDIRYGTRVADARGAAVADKVEAELVEEGRNASGIEVLGHDLRAWSERCLHPRLHREALVDGVFREQAGREHHARVRGVGAARDRGDHHGAVLQVEIRALVRAGDAFVVVLGVLLLRTAFIVLPDHGALHVRRSLRRLGLLLRFRRGGNRVQELGLVSGERFLVHRGGAAQRDTILRTARSGETRLHRGEIELDGVGEDRISRLVGAEDSLRPGVRLHEGDVRIAASAQAEVLERLGVYREKAHSRAILGSHVGNGRAIGQTE